jgi:hypothetical protein
MTSKVKAAFKIEETLKPGGRPPGTEVRDRGGVEPLPDICAGAGGHGRQGHQRDPAHRLHRSDHETTIRKEDDPCWLSLDSLHPFVVITANVPFLLIFRLSVWMVVTLHILR